MPNEPEIQDGFRPRRKRPKGWLKQAIKDGSVRDPKLGPNPKGGRRRDADGTVIDLPVMTVRGDERLAPPPCKGGG